MQRVHPDRDRFRHAAPSPRSARCRHRPRCSSRSSRRARRRTGASRGRSGVALPTSARPTRDLATQSIRAASPSTYVLAADHAVEWTPALSATSRIAVDPALGGQRPRRAAPAAGSARGGSVAPRALVHAGEGPSRDRHVAAAEHAERRRLGRTSARPRSEVPTFATATTSRPRRTGRAGPACGSPSAGRAGHSPVTGCPSDVAEVRARSCRSRPPVGDHSRSRVPSSGARPARIATVAIAVPRSRERAVRADDDARVTAAASDRSSGQDHARVLGAGHDHEIAHQRAAGGRPVAAPSDHVDRRGPERLDELCQVADGLGRAALGSAVDRRPRPRSRHAPRPVPASPDSSVRGSPASRCARQSSATASIGYASTFGTAS